MPNVNSTAAVSGNAPSAPPTQEGHGAAYQSPNGSPDLSIVKTKKTKARRDPDYSTAWRACGARLAPSVWGTDEEINLRAMLDDLLKSGWSIQALRSYAFAWRPRRDYDHVTPAAWRWGIYFANMDIGGRATEFLNSFKKRHGPANDSTVQAVGIAT
jgi:hypothetical protein